MLSVVGVLKIPAKKLSDNVFCVCTLLFLYQCCPVE